MADWSESALERLRRQVAAEGQNSEAQLRKAQIIEAKAYDYWSQLVSIIERNLEAFGSGSLAIRPLGLTWHVVPSAPLPTFYVDRFEYPRVELFLELIVLGRMIRFRRTTQAAWDGHPFDETGSFCLCVDDRDNVYLTYRGALTTEKQAVALLLDPVVFPSCPNPATHD